jgi:hypothetical protein
MMRRLLFLLVLVPALLLAFGCSSTKAPKREPIKGKLAVAPFHQPRLEWDLPEFGDEVQRRNVRDKVLKGLTQILMRELRERGHTSVRGPDSVQNCREIVLSRELASPDRASHYWADVARCASADSILVPQLISWREREGGRWGAESPASVALRLVWLDAQEKQVERAFHFQREQASLTENLWQIGSFIRRGGQWVSAEELAAEGIRSGLEDMGL